LGEDYFYYVHYPTYGAADHAICDHCILPPAIPPSANDIRYTSYYETPELWLFFKFDPREVSEIRKRCDRATKGEIELAPEPPRYLIDWPGNFIDWPEEITCDAPAKAEDLAGYEFYRCAYGTGKGTLAVDAEKGKAYYWGSF
jgi:hypothetical protein